MAWTCLIQAENIDRIEVWGIQFGPAFVTVWSTHSHFIGFIYNPELKMFIFLVLFLGYMYKEAFK